MSQARDVYNFFAVSQLTNSDADPIDVNANSTRPTELFEVVTQPQGILLLEHANSSGLVLWNWCADTNYK